MAHTLPAKIINALLTISTTIGLGFVMMVSLMTVFPTVGLSTALFLGLVGALIESEVFWGENNSALDRLFFNDPSKQYRSTGALFFSLIVGLASSGLTYTHTLSALCAWAGAMGTAPLWITQAATVISVTTCLATTLLYYNMLYRLFQSNIVQQVSTDLFELFTEGTTLKCMLSVLAALVILTSASIMVITTAGDWWQSCLKAANLLFSHASSASLLLTRLVPTIVIFAVYAPLSLTFILLNSARFLVTLVKAFSNSQNESYNNTLHEHETSLRAQINHAITITVQVVLLVIHVITLGMIAGEGAVLNHAGNFAITAIIASAITELFTDAHFVIDLEPSINEHDHGECDHLCDGDHSHGVITSTLCQPLHTFVNLVVADDSNDEQRAAFFENEQQSDDDQSVNSSYSVEPIVNSANGLQLKLLFT